MSTGFHVAHVKVGNVLSTRQLKDYALAVATLGQNLKRLRIRAKLERRQVGERLGLAGGSTYLADIENDRYDNVGLNRALEFARILGVTIEELVAGIDEKYDVLSRHTRRLKPTHPTEESAVDAAAIEARLVEQFKTHHAQVLDQIAEHATKIINLGLALSEGRSVDSRQAGRGKAAGKGRR